MFIAFQQCCQLTTKQWYIIQGKINGEEETSSPILEYINWNIKTK